MSSQPSRRTLFFFLLACIGIGIAVAGWGLFLAGITQ